MSSVFSHLINLTVDDYNLFTVANSILNLMTKQILLNNTFLTLNSVKLKRDIESYKKRRKIKKKELSF